MFNYIWVFEVFFLDIDHLNTINNKPKETGHCVQSQAKVVPGVWDYCDWRLIEVLWHLETWINGEVCLQVILCTPVYHSLFVGLHKRIWRPCSFPSVWTYECWTSVTHPSGTFQISARDHFETWPGEKNTQWNCLVNLTLGHLLKEAIEKDQIHHELSRKSCLFEKGISKQIRGSKYYLRKESKFPQKVASFFITFLTR